MSRIGNKTITIPAGVEVTVSAGNEVTVKGPKGTLSRQFSTLISINVDGSTIVCTRANEEKHTKQLHGTTRALIHNMIVGVNEAYSKTLEIEGIGYRAALQGGKLVMNLGYSHPVEMEAPEGITFDVPSANSIIVRGVSKELVGQTAAVVRSKRPPEVYRGKGSKYVEEHIIRKEDNTVKK